jgi:1,4-dihydroxy-2-naphthoate octaprenyltransferase
MKKDDESKSMRKLLNSAGIVYLIFTFSLGISAAHYLGARLDLPTLLIGLGVCVLLRMMGRFLSAYFNHPESFTSTLSLSDPEREELLSIRRPLLFQYSLLILTAAATLTTLLIIRGAISTSSGLLLGSALLLIILSAVPPVRLSQIGYGELVDALFIANLAPAIAFSLAGLTVSAFIIELTLPLTLIYLAMRIALAFITHGFDSMHGRLSLTVRLGWQNALVLHNIFILFAFVLVGIFLQLGFPWSLTWPILLALPVGIFQIFYLQSIANGAPPKWVLLRWLAVGLFLLVVYLEIISLWI